MQFELDLFQRLEPRSGYRVRGLLAEGLGASHSACEGGAILRDIQDPSH